MAKTISELKAQSAEVKNASAIGENTATRVGQLFTDIVEHVEQYETNKDNKDASQDAEIKSLVSAEESRAKGEERGLQNQIHAEEIDRKTADTYLTNLIQQENSARETADENIRTALANETARAQAAEQELAAAQIYTAKIKDGAVTTPKIADGAVTYEKTDIIAQELGTNITKVPSQKVVTDAIQKEETERKADVNGLAAALASENIQREQGDENLNAAIDAEAEARDNAINNEAQARSKNDALLNQAIVAEIDRAKAREQELTVAILQETERAQAAEEANAAAIEAEAEARDNAINNEAQARSRNDALLNQAIVAEKDRAEAREQELTVAIQQETERAEAREQELTVAIQQETERAMNAEEANATSVIGTERIADKAVTSDKLVDGSLIEQLKKTATFAGIATPTTNPDTPDGHVFYIATEAGIYSNFNNIEVIKGEAVIFKWDNGMWSKNVTGFATQEKLSELEQKINGGEIEGEVYSYKETKGMQKPSFSLSPYCGSLQSGTKLRIRVIESIGAVNGDDCYLHLEGHTNTGTTSILIDSATIKMGQEYYIDCSTTLPLTDILLFETYKVGRGTGYKGAIDFSILSEHEGVFVKKEDFEPFSEKVQESFDNFEKEINETKESIKNIDFTASMYKNADYTKSIGYKLHDFNATGRTTFNGIGTINLDKWYILPNSQIKKSGVLLTSFSVEYMRGNTKTTIFVGIFKKNGEEYTLKHLLYGNDETDKGHNGHIIIPSESGVGFGISTLQYSTDIKYYLQQGDFIGIKPRNSWICCYTDGEGVVLSELGNDSFSANNTNIAPSVHFTTTDAEDIEQYEIQTRESLRRYKTLEPTIIRRATKFICTQDTKILLLGDSIASDTMIGGSVQEHNYNGYQKALSELLNIPMDNIIRAGSPGSGTGYFSSDIAWLTNGLKAVIPANPDVIISIVGANEKGNKWSVGSFDGIIEGEPIVPDLDFDTQSSQGTYGTNGASYFIQNVSFIIQRYINTYYNVRERAEVLQSDSVEIADEKMSSVKIPYLIICTNLPQNRGGEFFEFSYPENWKRKRDAIVEVCNKYNIECVDLLSAMPWDASKEPTFVSAEWVNKGIYTMDGLHPNYVGFRKIAGIICNEAGLVKADN